MTSQGQDRSSEDWATATEVDELDQILSAGTWAKTGAKRPAPYGTPEVRGDIDSQMQANGNLQTNDSMSFVISCRIVDKRPNGNLVLEGTWNVSNNEENWEYSLSGEGPSGRHQAGQLGRQRHDRRSEDHQAGSGPRPRQLSPRLGLGVARQVAAVLGRRVGPERVARPAHQSRI